MYVSMSTCIFNRYVSDCFALFGVFAMLRSGFEPISYRESVNQKIYAFTNPENKARTNGSCVFCFYHGLMCGMNAA